MKIIKKRFVVAALAAACFFLFYKSNYEVPVLMYHHVGAPGDPSSLNVSLETFERQMEFLKVHRYDVMPAEEMVRMIKLGQPLPAKAVAITFDDGHLDNIKNAFPVLKKMNFPATIFMITRNINEIDSLSEEDLRILDESGVSIGSHTVNHAFLPKVATADILFEITESKKKLEKVLGHPVALISYPAGGFTQEARLLVEKEGYEGGLTTNHGKGKHDPYALHRIKATESGGSLFSFWIKTSGLYHLGKKRIDVQ